MRSRYWTTLIHNCKWLKSPAVQPREEGIEGVRPKYTQPQEQKYNQPRSQPGANNISHFLSFFQLFGGETLSHHTREGETLATLFSCSLCCPCGLPNACSCFLCTLVSFWVLPCIELLLSRPDTLCFFYRGRIKQINISNLVFSSRDMWAESQPAFSVA